jgi:hypothetical protein
MTLKTSLMLKALVRKFQARSFGSACMLAATSTIQLKTKTTTTEKTEKTKKTKKTEKTEADIQSLKLPRKRRR